MKSTATLAVHGVPPASTRALFPHPCPAVNGVAFHPFLPLLATASGQRRFFLAPADDSEDDSSSGSDSDSPQPASAAWPLLEPGENVLRVWQAAHELPAPAEPEAPAGAEQQPEAGAEGGQDGDEAMQDVVS